MSASRPVWIGPWVRQSLCLYSSLGPMTRILDLPLSCATIRASAIIAIVVITEAGLNGEVIA